MDRLGTQFPEHDLESAQQCRALLRLGLTQWHPASRTTAQAPKLNTQKCEMTTSRQIRSIGLVLIYFYVEFAEFLSKSLFHRPLKPALLRVAA